MPQGKAVYIRSREGQQRLDAFNTAAQPLLKIVVRKTDCFTKEFVIVLDKKELLIIEGEDRWAYTLTLAEAVHQALRKGQELGMAAGRKKEFERGKAFHTAFYDT